jgi:hypothetical protein
MYYGSNSTADHCLTLQDSEVLTTSTGGLCKYLPVNLDLFSFFGGPSFFPLRFPLSPLVVSPPDSVSRLIDQLLKCCHKAVVFLKLIKRGCIYYHNSYCRQVSQELKPYEGLPPSYLIAPEL